MKQALAAVSLSAVVAGSMMPGAAVSQAYPSKPVRVVTEFSAGSGGDLLVRVVTPPVAEILGQPVVVENRGGAGGVLAAETVIRAAPDGYTLLAGTTNPLVVRRFLTRKMSFDTLKDLTPITAVGDTLTVIVAHPGLAQRTLQDVIEYAKANPGKLSYGTSGVGSTHHLSQEQIKQLTGADIVHVPYKSGAMAIADVAGGQIPMSYSIIASGASFIRSGKVRVLAQVTSKRSSLMPDVPAVSEVVPGFQQAPSWTAFFAPAGLPQPVLQRISAAMLKGMRAPETRAKIAELGFDPIANTPEEFTVMIRQQIELVAKLVKAANIKPTD